MEAYYNTEKIIQYIWYSLLGDNQLIAIETKRLTKIGASLRRLILAGNRIERLESGSFEMFPKLEDLDLQGNQILDIAPEHLRGLTQLKYLYAQINCDSLCYDNEFVDKEYEISKEKHSKLVYLNYRYGDKWN